MSPTPTATATPTPTPREVIRRYLSHLSSRDWPALASAFHPSATYWVAGAAPFSGALPASARVPGMAALMDSFAAYSFTATAIIVGGGEGGVEEGGDGEATVVVEGRPRGEGPGGEVLYENEVIMVFRVRAGRIVEKREWLSVMPREELFEGLGV